MAHFNPLVIHWSVLQFLKIICDPRLLEKLLDRGPGVRVAVQTPQDEILGFIRYVTPVFMCGVFKLNDLVVDIPINFFDRV